MPYLNLLYSAADEAIAPELAAELTRITGETLGKKKELTVVAIRRLTPEQWFVGGEALAPGQTGAVLEIRITEGTNTKAQKAAFVRAAFDALARLLRNLHSTSYVTVHEPSADAWGYGGETQEYRYIRSQVP